MRQRFQNGCVRKSKDGRYWVGQWRENGRLRSRVLGKVSSMTKSKAREKLAAILKPINERAAYVVDEDVTTKDFVEKEYLPFYKRKWKESTAATAKDNIRYHLTGDLGMFEMSSFTREQLQELLSLCEQVNATSKLINGKVTNGYTYSKETGEVPIIENGKVIEDPSVAQKLLPTTKEMQAKGITRVPTNEIMRTSPIVRKLILNEEDNKLGDAIRIGKEEGMQDFTESLRRLVVEEKIERATAFEVAPSVETLKMALKGINIAQPGIL